MKKIFIVLFGIVLSFSGVAQYFQGSFTKDVNNSTNYKISFKMKPTATMTTAISYIEVAFRYPTSGTPAFVVNSITSNNVNFPNLAMQRFPPDYNDGTYTYVKFVHNTATVPSATYTSGTEYEIFNVVLNTANPGPDAVIPQIEMVSNLVLQNYQFGVLDGAGNLLDPGAGAELYGPGFSINGQTHILPLANVTVPVKFTGFTATKRNDDAVLNWTVENESSITDRYEIERSLNAVDFTKIATVAPKYSGSSNVYDATDLRLSSVRTNGAIYYRIKQIDKDGKFIYSEIKSVRMDKGLVISTYPNPVKDVTTVTLDLLEAADVSIAVNDAAGKELQKITIKGQKGINTKKVDLGAYAAGTYLLKVSIGSDVKTLSVVKAQ
ncbi:MAG: T9SS type A sorting domain-containing protein [Ferruginibacter sp.]